MNLPVYFMLHHSDVDCKMGSIHFLFFMQLMAWVLYYWSRIQQAINYVYTWSVMCCVGLPNHHLRRVHNLKGTHSCISGRHKWDPSNGLFWKRHLSFIQFSIFSIALFLRYPTNFLSSCGIICVSYLTIQSKVLLYVLIIK